jgi:hypothetical protein
MLDRRPKAAYIQAVKVAAHRRSAKSKVNLHAKFFSLSTAKTYLGRLVKKAGLGETVYIVTGHRRFILQEVPEFEAIPMRPAGYFADAYTKAQIQEDNVLAKASVVRAPKDLE